MENSISMNGREGPNSYSKNSKIQKQAIDLAEDFISKGIVETLELQKDLQVFSIADFGCSVGPNTFSSVDIIIQAVQRKYKTEAPELKILEFHVFFNDHVINDFNTLFKTLPPGRQYIIAGVPGSFRGRLLPKSSINLMHSTASLHRLPQIPNEVMKEDSPAWNKGRISYPFSSNQVVEAFTTQFLRDLEAFMKARSAELAPGGLLVLLIPGRPDGTHPSESRAAHSLECLSDALVDKLKEGLVSEDLLDSFNMPVFFPSASEVKGVVWSKSHINIERVEEICYGNNFSYPGYAQLYTAHVRAATESILCEQFGTNLIDDIFGRYLEKLETFSKTPRSLHVEKTNKLLLLVLRSVAS